MSVRSAFLELPRSLKLLLFVALAIGIWLRLSHLETKVFWQDESFTALHATGHLDVRDLRPLFDGRVHSIQDFQRLEEVSPRYGVRAAVSAVASEDRHQGVLYHVLERLSLQLFGNSITADRILSAIFGVLAIPLAFLAAFELFASGAVATVFAAIIALSPFQVLYAHEARGYAMTSFVLLLSTYLFLRATKIRTTTSWAIYAVSIPIALYTHILSMLVFVAHFLYSMTLPELRRNRAPFIALVVGTLMYAPWLAVLISGRRDVEVQMEWGASQYPVKLFIEKWLFNINAQFFDLEWLSLKYAVIGVVILALSAYSIFFLIRRGTRAQWLFVLLLAGATAIPMIGRDLIEHSHWSLIARYMIPSWLALQLAVAYCLASQAAWSGWGIRAARGWALVIVALLSVEAISAIVNTRAQSWYDDVQDAAAPQIAERINQSRSPLIVGEHAWTFYLMLSRYLHTDVKVQLFADSRDKPLIDASLSRDVFVPTPSSYFRASLERQGFTLRRVYDYGDRSSPYAVFHAAASGGEAERPTSELSSEPTSFPHQLYLLVPRN